MTEQQFDQDLRQALQQGPSKSLEGWEFTPAMRQQVLDRIRTNVTEAPIGQKRRAPAVPRPLVWAVVAAAAVIFVVKIDLGGLGGAGKSQEAAESPMTPQRSAASVTTAAPAPMEMKSEAAPLAAPAAPTEQPAAKAAVPAPAGASMAGATAIASEVPHVTLMAPSLTAALRDDTKGPDTFGAMAISVGVTGTTGSQGITVRDGRLVGVDGQGNPRWETPIPGLSPASQMAVGRDGSVAVAAGRKISVVSPTGKLLRSMEAAGEVASIAYGDGERVAVSHGAGVEVFDRGVLRYSIAAAKNAEIALAGNGSVAAVYGGPGGTQVQANDPDGRPLFGPQRLDGTGEGVAFAPDGDVLLAGEVGLGLDGLERWRMGPDTQHVLALESNRALVGWNSNTIAAVGPTSGRRLWYAAWSGEGPGIFSAVASADGRYLVALAQEAQGGSVWLLNSAGELIRVERLVDLPVSAVVVSDRVLLSMPDGTYRSFPVAP